MGCSQCVSGVFLECFRVVFRGVSGVGCFGMLLECFWGVSGVFLGCFWDVSGVFLGCFRDASGMLLGCFRDASGMLPGCFRDASGVFPGCFWGVSGMLLECSWSVSGVFPVCFRDVSGVLLGCFWSVSGLRKSLGSPPTLVTLLFCFCSVSVCLGMVALVSPLAPTPIRQESVKNYKKTATRVSLAPCSSIGHGWERLRRLCDHLRGSASCAGARRAF